jgi:hypothetical protein
MNRSLPDPRAKWDTGCRMACEGILRSHFGLRSSDAVKKAMGRLRRAEGAVTEDVQSTSRRSARKSVLYPFDLSKQSVSLLALAASIVILIAFRFLLPPAGVPTLSSMRGKGAMLERSGQELPPRLGMIFRPGDILRLSENAAATITFPPEKTRISLSPSTELALSSISSGKLFFLRFGTLEASVARQRPFYPMRIRTAQAEARVLGTKLTLKASINSTDLEVDEGKVRLTFLETGAYTDVLAKHHAVAAQNVTLAALPRTGELIREYWTNLPGSHQVQLTSNPRFPLHPDGWERLVRFEVVPTEMTDFGDRIRAYLQPPKTGSYRFFISAADDASLFLSPDEEPDHKVPIGYSERAQAGDEWNQKRSQQDLTLIAGQRYYIETVRKCGTGSDHLAVAWQPPGGEREIIPARFLSLYGKAYKK